MSVDHGVLYGKIAEYTEILASDQSSPVFTELSEVYRQLGMLEEAANVATQGLSFNPNSIPGLVSLGRVTAQQGNVAGALDAFERAEALDGTALIVLTGLARVLMMQGNKERAREIAQRAVQVNPNDPTAKKILVGLGAPVVESPATTESVETSSVIPASAQAGMEPIATQTIAELYERQGLIDRALKVYKDLAQSDPANAALKQKIAELQGQVMNPPGTEPESVPVQRETIQAEAVTTPSSHDNYLDSLNRWLNAIQQRRAHV